MSDDSATKKNAQAPTVSISQHVDTQHQFTCRLKRQAPETENTTSDGEKSPQVKLGKQSPFPSYSPPPSPKSMPCLFLMAVLYFDIAEGAELLAALQKQIEFYFSRENLNKDQYLVSQMDSQMFVPVVTIQQVCSFVC